jgi:hypothetical protein
VSSSQRVLDRILQQTSVGTTSETRASCTTTLVRAAIASFRILNSQHLKRAMRDSADSDSSIRMGSVKIKS